jgi:hypothetical protein
MFSTVESLATNRAHLGRADRRGPDGVEGAREAVRRRASGADEGLPAVAGEPGEDAECTRKRKLIALAKGEGREA